jgi:hypothetical protein
MNSTLVKAFARIRQRQSPRGAMQQPAAKASFQLTDTSTDDRFRNAESLTGGTECPGFHDSGKGFNIGEPVHIVADYRTVNS